MPLKPPAPNPPPPVHERDDTPVAYYVFVAMIVIAAVCLAVAVALRAEKCSSVGGSHAPAVASVVDGASLGIRAKTFQKSREVAAVDGHAHSNAIGQHFKPNASEAGKRSGRAGPGRSIYQSLATWSSPVAHQAHNLGGPWFESRRRNGRVDFVGFKRGPISVRNSAANVERDGVTAGRDQQHSGLHPAARVGSRSARLRPELDRNGDPRTPLGNSAGVTARRDGNLNAWRAT